MSSGICAFLAVKEVTGQEMPEWREAVQSHNEEGGVQEGWLLQVSGLAVSSSSAS